MGYLGATLTQVFTCAGGADVSLRDVTIAQMGNGTSKCGWRHAPEAHGGFGGFWKSQLVEFCLGRRRLAFACLLKPGQWPCGGCHTCWEGADGKVIIERLCISLPYVETFNSKVIKSFVPELRSRYVFFVFRDTHVMNIICTFHTYLYHGLVQQEWFIYTNNYGIY